MKNLLIELQTEELPPKALKSLSEAFATGVFNHLKNQHFVAADSQVKAFGAPRRLGVWISNVLEVTPEEAFKQKLVPVSVGLTAEGQATPALLKKMAALGIECDVSALTKVNDGKNEQLVFEGVRPGVQLSVGLQSALESAIKALPIPKVMTYQLNDGVTTVEFVRPVKHLIALHGTDIVDVKVLGLQANRITKGHRFHVKDDVVIADADSYEQTLKANKVIADYVARRAEICKLLTARAGQLGATPIMPDDLVDEVTALTEWPVIYDSKFEEEFLQVPQECLILTMQLNQKYFALRDANGSLMNRFLLVSQLEAKDGGQAISSGNARVIRARLADAKFFYDQDRLIKLESRVEGLSNVVYHNKLGSQLARVKRLEVMAGKIAELIQADASLARRAAYLAKADLRTLMVGEFPELQGIMGEYYALHDGEDPLVAKAIKEHYQPRYAGDALPSTPVSLAVTLADKLETLVGLFSIGQMPTGEKDPFALRRHALGVIRMLMEKKLDVSLPALFEVAWQSIQTIEGVKDERASLMSFFYDRLRVVLREKGFSAQEVEAVLSKQPEKLFDVQARLEAVQAFAKLSAAEALSAANKRISNILKKVETTQLPAINEGLLVEAPERALWDKLIEIEPELSAARQARNYEQMLLTVAQLETVVDAFFKDVMVNADDQALRLNRQALLARAYEAMNEVAEIARLAK